VLIDEDRWLRLEHEATRRGVSVGLLVREAIDQRYPIDPEVRRLALQSFLDAAPMAVPDVEGLRRELDEYRGRHDTGT
jgi:hypothetical protein